MDNKTESATKRMKKNAWLPILSVVYCKHMEELQHEDGCKQIDAVRTRLNSKKERFEEEEALLILEDGFKYISDEWFPEYEEGITVAIDHMWAMGIILSYLLCSYPALKGTEDIKCYNNMGVGPEVQFGEQDRLEGNENT
eukprot:jgi/Psemu1/20816/gm1.20816_g